MRNQDEIHEELEQLQWILRLKQLWIRREEELERRLEEIGDDTTFCIIYLFTIPYSSLLPLSLLSLFYSLSLLFTLTLTKQYTKGLNGSIEVFLLLPPPPSRFLCLLPLSPPSPSLFSLYSLRLLLPSHSHR